MYRVQLDDAARQELHRRSHQFHVAPRTRDRLEMIRLSDKGWSVPQIARHMSCHEQTARYWIKTFLVEGFDGLEDKPHTGKASAITPDILTAVREWVAKADRVWSAGQIAQEVQSVYGIARSVDQWRDLLKKEGLTYKRTSRHLHHKQNPEQVATKRTALEALQKRGSPAR